MNFFDLIILDMQVIVLTRSHRHELKFQKTRTTDHFTLLFDK